LACLTLAKNIVISKIENQRTLLRRNNKSNLTESLKFLKRISKQIDTAQNLDGLRGFEGIAAQKYWGNFHTMLNADCEFYIKTRNGYSLLTRDFSAALTSVGFDYLLGFYHAIVAGRPVFSLNMMKAYLPLIVDSIVLRLVNERQVGKSDFVVFDSGVYMSPQAKRKVITAYERLVDEMITHPKFGYRLSYRRMFMLEVNLITYDIADKKRWDS
jgi:CRISPR-associated protein Cas1